MKTKLQLGAGIVALVALLVYTLMHTGTALANYVQPAYVGFVAAFGIELSIVSLSLRIGELRQRRQDTKFFVFVLLAVVVVSAVANVSEGFKTAYNEHLTVDNLAQLDIVQAAIGLAMTGLISLIVLALSEILGTDVSDSQRQVTTVSTRASDRKVTAPKRQRQPVSVSSDTQARRQQVAALVAEDRQADDIAEALAVSVRTVYRDIKAVRNGKPA